MICNVCGTQEATIHLTEIVNNQMMEIHLCETCAQEKGTDFKTHFNLTDLLINLSDIKNLKSGEKQKTTARCLECGLTYEEFAKNGRLGCGDCYSSFAKLLNPLIKRVQRGMHHIGKKPLKIAGETRAAHDLRMLQDRLRKSIQSESFEEAAALRDEIRQAEEKLKKGKKSKSE